MTDHDPSFPRKARWLAWLGLAHEEHADSSSAGAHPEEGAAHFYRDPTPQEVWLPAKRRMLGKITDFLIDHDLDVLPFTLGVAYDCVTGASPRLAQLILERTEAGQLVNLRWLEEVAREHDNDKSTEVLTSLMNRLERSLDELGETTAGARSATSEYNSALREHFDELEEASETNAVISRLAKLTEAMIDRTHQIEKQLCESEQRTRELQRTLDETRQVANHDHLTGLPNRRAFEHLLEREYREALASGEALAIAFCDIDHFKRINDVHGHPAGDRVLKFVAESLDKISDARCYVARHGGEEFAVLFRGITVEKAYRKLDATREEIAQRRLVNRVTDLPFGSVTFSAGLADLFSYADKSAALKAADEALYVAKESGRNQIVIARGGGHGFEAAA
ncbi:diguanylate cyclase [Novosphingobium sp. EMRT-2]|uniref:GGDEF domain-containing protein n=1 Tax=Novosphingobium sp. EMRT-2 TaxID=2571749 RepID=UPI0010BD3211|nr:GGDEF domain-containing protein [Novosphingobium sp. EMRT-2]QCI92702.1 diguanylate cyclase [Novosphingobium sp. EMRT-2]